MGGVVLGRDADKRDILFAAPAGRWRSSQREYKGGGGQTF
jgi:hypothetical protein